MNEHIVAPHAAQAFSAALAFTLYYAAAAEPAPARTLEANLAAASVDWPSYNNDLGSQRFSPLAQIDPQNVGHLHQICSVNIGQAPLNWQTGPIVIGGILYATSANTTTALDAATCRIRWTNTYPNPFSIYSTNRGAAYGNGRVFRGTSDGHVQAIDARSGATVWDRRVIATGSLEAINAAPIVWRGALYIGTAGGDSGQAGHVFALDQIDGRTLWQQQTVPNLGTPLAASWGGAQRIAGGSTWSSYTLDAANAALYVSTGNAAPDFDDRLRIGSNAYANSVVVLDAFSGTLRAGYALVPGDPHDWDMGATPLLAYAPTRARPLMAYAAGKDGYLHAIDTGIKREIWKTPVTTIDNAAAPMTIGGTHFCPGTSGGVEWNGPTLLPMLHLLFVNSVDWCTTIALAPTPQPYVPGREWLGSTNGGGGYDRYRKFGWVTAVDATTGAVRWRWRSTTPLISGITATAGGLVFSGDLCGDLLAFDARNGVLLAHIPTSRAIGGGIISYAVGGKQYIAAAAGLTSPGWQTRGTAELAVFSL